MPRTALAPQIALHDDIVFDVAAQTHLFILGEILHMGGRIYLHSREDLVGRRPTDPEHIGQTDLYLLVPGEGNSSDTSHS